MQPWDIILEELNKILELDMDIFKSENSSMLLMVKLLSSTDIFPCIKNCVIDEVRDSSWFIIITLSMQLKIFPLQVSLQSHWIKQSLSIHLLLQLLPIKFLLQTQDPFPLIPSKQYPLRQDLKCETINRGG